MIPCGLENYGTGCWLNSILVTLESCNSFVSLFEKYAKDIERAGSKPLFLFQKKHNTSLLMQLTKFLSDRKTNRDPAITPPEILCTLVPKKFPRDRENDSAEAWDLMMEQLFLELEQVQSDWAQRMHRDLSELIHVSYKTGARCMKGDSGDDRCKDEECLEFTNSLHCALNVNRIFPEEKKKGKYELLKYLSFQDKLLEATSCSYCEGTKVSSLFKITHYPTILKIDLSRADKFGQVHEKVVSFPLEMTLENINYKFIAMFEHVDRDFDQEAGYSGHIIAVAMRQGKLFQFDDERVTECSIPRSGLKNSKKVSSIFYERVDWESCIVPRQVPYPKYPKFAYNIYSPLLEYYSKRIEIKTVNDESLHSGMVIVDKGESMTSLQCIDKGMTSNEYFFL